MFCKFSVLDEIKSDILQLSGNRVMKWHRIHINVINTSVGGRHACNKFVYYKVKKQNKSIEQNIIIYC